MLKSVEVGSQSLGAYRWSAGDDAVDEVIDLARPLQGARILHVNATPYGGGVAEILRSEVPLLRDLGLCADWRLIVGNSRFFEVTKAMHNGLQGAPRELTADQQEEYLAHSRTNAGLVEGDYDLVVVHDPQPLAIPAIRGKDDGAWVWRCHIDTSEPNPQVWAFLRSFLEAYDAAVFTLGGFVCPDLPLGRVEIIPPAIDPENPKNLHLDSSIAKRVLGWIGVDVSRPMVTQVSRFDPWKDPLGVIAAHRLVKEEIGDVQLALVGSMAMDDPEAWRVYDEIQEEVHDDDTVDLFTNLTGVGNIEVNAFQRLSDVVVQKSIREGFGLVVSESLWKETPVVAGRAGGIPLQLQDGAGGHLVDSVEECAARVVDLLRDPEERASLGATGRALVQRRFLLTRLLADELRLYASLLGHRPSPGTLGTAGLVDEPRDPVCGMRVDPDTAVRREVGHRQWLFCSSSCADQFERDPTPYLRAEPTPPQP